jgi:hypothetical protein
MIQEVTLRPVQSEGKVTVNFRGEYFDRDKKNKIILIEPYGVVINRDLNKSTERIFNQWFDQNNSEVTIRWDDEKDRSTNDFVTYLQKHPQVICEGFVNPNKQGTPQFEFVDKRKKDVAKVRALKQKNVVFNMVNNMTIGDMMDVAFFVGFNPVGRSFEEVFVSLLDYSNGILMRDASGFLSTWSSPDKAHTVIVNKAINLSIINQRAGKYYAGAGNEIVGDDFESVLAYMKVNDKVYDFVKRQVAERDTLPLDVNKEDIDKSVSKFEQDGAKYRESRIKNPTDKANDRAANELKKVAIFDEKAALIARGKSLGIPGIQMGHSWTLERLKEKIAIAEQSLTQPATV